MFKHPGKKIKNLAIVVFVVLFVMSWVAGALTALAVYEELGRLAVSFLAGVLIAVLGCLSAWISALFTFAFGNLVDDVQAIKARLDKPARDIAPRPL